MKSDLVDLDLFVVRDEKTEQAILVQDEIGGKKVWLPRSQIEIEYVGGKNPYAARVTLPEWLAIDKGLA